MKLQVKKWKNFSLVLIMVITSASLLSSLPLFIRESKLSPNLSYSEYKEAPSQWADFNFNPYGAGIWAGELLEDGGVFTIIRSDSYFFTSSEHYKGYIKPGIQGSESNADIITQWNNADGPPHWSKLDEAKGDMNGDGGNIRENVVGRCDKWRFTSLTLDPGEYVTKLVYWAYIKEQESTTTTYVDIDTSASTSGYWETTGSNYQWKSYTKSGLWLSQSALDGFWLQAKITDVPAWMEEYNPGWIDINTVYVDVYAKYQGTYYKHDWTVLWDVNDIELFSIDALHYDFRATNPGVTTTLQIWNYDINNWDPTPVVTHSGATWGSGIFDLNLDFISNNDEVKLRFSTNSITSSFDLYFDLLYLAYSRMDGTIDLAVPEGGHTYGTGYFKSSYGFDCDVSGNPPTGWTTETQGGTIKVIDEVSGYDAHKKVVEFHDTNENDVVEMSQPLPDDYYGGQNGVIDFYVKASEIKPFYIVIQDGSESNSIYLFFDDDGKIKYKASSVHNIMPYHEGKWYHFQIFYAFNLGPHWTLIVNGIGHGPFISRGDPELLDSIRFFTSSSHTNYKYYIDAIGYEWDPGYDHGDNEVTGLPLKFTHHYLDAYTYEIDQIDQGYLYDPPTFSGINYIPLPDDGEHTIKVIGIESGSESNEVTFYSEINEILDWGTDLINAEVVWGGVEDAVDVDPTYGTPSGQGINVLVIDSGIDWTHDELWTNIQGFDFDYVEYDDNPWDENGHGTHCAGIIAAEDNDRGIIGVAPNVNIYVARILNEYGLMQDFSDAGQAVQWAIDTHHDINPSNDIDIISMSFGGPQGDIFASWFEQKCINAANEGIICIAASGNYNPLFYNTHKITDPAAFESVISVGAVEQSGDYVERPDFSCYIGDLDLVAPGVDIVSSACEPLDGSEDDEDGIINGYATCSGTSMACPMVSGVVALILSASQAIYDLTGTDRVDAIKECLFETADNSTIIDYTFDECGHGVVMADDAVNYAIDPQRPWN